MATVYRGDSIYASTFGHPPSCNSFLKRAPGQIEVLGPDQLDQITGVELKSETFREIESQIG